MVPKRKKKDISIKKFGLSENQGLPIKQLEFLENLGKLSSNKQQRKQTGVKGSGGVS